MTNETEERRQSTEARLGSFTIKAKSPLEDAPDPEDELKRAVEEALAEYTPDDGEAVPTASDFELREEHPTGAETLLVVFLTAAATAAGKKFGERTVNAIWDLIAAKLSASRKARVEVKDEGAP